MQQEVVDVVVSAVVYCCFIIGILTGGYGLSLKAEKVFKDIKTKLTEN